jgi:hypothetical protein
MRSRWIASLLLVPVLSFATTARAEPPTARDERGTNEVLLASGLALATVAYAARLGFLSPEGAQMGAQWYVPFVGGVVDGFRFTVASLALGGDEAGKGVGAFALGWVEGGGLAMALAGAIGLSRAAAPRATGLRVAPMGAGLSVSGSW